ncbi:MAG TPA: DUF6427 family protein [Bacteroidales bacterium]|jgi:hypothetical protein|nr:DUF6427 family protein [Bacteroidales bacterium]HQJ82893.1 DUF6427 family protein [Bacteroidales bacterium]
MFSKLFRGTGPGVIFLIVVILALMWISAFIEPGTGEAAVYESDPMPLYAVVKMITGPNVWSGLIFTMLVLIFVLFLLVNFNTSVFFIGERTFFPAFMYILMTALLPFNQVPNPVLPAIVFLMLALKRIMGSYRKAGTAFNFFDAALFISTGSLFYANLIWFGAVVFIGIILLRSGNIIEITTSVIGLATPYIILAGIYYVIGKDVSLPVSVLGENLFAEPAEFALSRIETLTLVFTGLMILTAVAFLLKMIDSRKIKSRKTFYLLLWVMIITVVVYFTVPSASAELLWIFAIPVSYILSHYFIFVRKKVVPEIMFSGFFLLVLLVQVLSLL